MVPQAQGISPADDGDKQMTTIPPTENQDWSFWGTMREHARQSFGWMTRTSASVTATPMRQRGRGYTRLVVTA
jgi:hypothetical protein